MFNILVVDDSAVDRLLIQGLLNKHEHFEIDTAEDGAIALEKIRIKAPDLVLTDMQMPNLDGLQLVEKIRVHHSSVPVILVTGEGSEDLACLALQRGAAGYVPKLRCAELLQNTIEHVMELRRSEASFKRLIDSSTLCQFEYLIDNDVTLIAPMVELAQRMCTGMKICDEAGCMQIGVAFEHAISNAIYHGNLELGSESIDNSAVITQRLKQAPYCHRQVRVELRITRDAAQFVVSDEGSGFNVKEMMSKARQLALSGGAGRGLFLMWAFMDSLTYDEKGNTIVMIKRRAPRVSADSVAGATRAELPTVMGLVDPHDRSAPISLTSGELRTVIKRLSQLNSDADLRNANQQEFIELLRVFKDQLVQRFEAFGYFEEAVKSASNGGRQSQRLRDQHKELYERAQRVLVEATNSAVDFTRLSKQVHELLHDLEVYEAAETEIIVNAMFQDIGGGD